jgi:hypothetical protein
MWAESPVSGFCQRIGAKRLQASLVDEITGFHPCFEDRELVGIVAVVHDHVVTRPYEAV